MLLLACCLLAACERSGNYHTLRKHIKRQFEANRGLHEAAAIERARETAIRGISNYLLFRASTLLPGAGAGERDIFAEAADEARKERQATAMSKRAEVARDARRRAADADEADEEAEPRTQK